MIKLSNIIYCGFIVVNPVQFFEAVKIGDIATVSQQLEAGISVNEVNADGETALHIAAQENQIAMIHLLLKHPDIEPNKENATHAIPLPQAIGDYSSTGKSRLETIEALLSSPKVSLYWDHIHNDRQLTKVITDEKQDILNLLLKRGDFQSNKFLYTAILHKKPEIFKKLFLHEEINQRSYHFYFCLEHAVSFRCPEILKFLLENRGPIEIEKIRFTNQRGQTLLHDAVYMYQNTIPLSTHSDHEFRENIRQTISLLLDIPEINVNAQDDEDGNTALHLAASHKSTLNLIPLFLAKSGLDLSIQNNQGKTVSDSIQKGLKHLASDFFTPVVFVCDDLLTVKESSKNSTDPKTLQNIRFIKILRELPMELQMHICNLAVGLNRDSIVNTHSELAFKYFVRLIERFPLTSDKMTVTHKDPVHPEPVDLTPPLLPAAPLTPAAPPSTPPKKTLLSLNTLREAIALIQRQRTHNPITTWLAKFFGLNLRQEKNKLTRKFIGFLNEGKNNLSLQDFEKYLARFKVAQQALERSRLAKGSKKAEHLMSELIQAKTDNETALFSQFKSHQKPLDVRKRYGIQKEENRYKKIKRFVMKSA